MTWLPRQPLPPMQRIFFMIAATIIIIQSAVMHSQNQFIESDQLQRIYFADLELNKDHHRTSQAANFAEQIVLRVAAKIENGGVCICQASNNVSELLRSDLTDQARMILHNRNKIEQKRRMNSLLYLPNSCVQQNEYPPTLLSVENHKKFIQEINLQKLQGRNRVKKIEHFRKQREKSLQQIQKQDEKQKLLQIEKKRKSILQNLRKMKENHEQIIKKEKQSRIIVKRLRNRTHLYQDLKARHLQNAILPQALEKRLKLKDIRQHFKLDLESINQHEKEYLQWKKSHSSRDKIETVHQEYKPPLRTSKMAKILEEQQKEIKSKLQRQKQRIQEKISRISNYSLQQRDQRLKNKNRTNTTVSSYRQEPHIQDATQGQKRQNTDRICLGNQYLKQATDLSRKRTKTEAKSQGQASNLQIKGKGQNSQWEEIESIVNCPRLNAEQKVRKLKRRDHALSVQIKIREGRIQQTKERKALEILGILIKTIKTKMDLLKNYQL